MYFLKRRVNLSTRAVTVDAGNPLPVAALMGVDMMHAARVPRLVSRAGDGVRKSVAFGVIVERQARDLNGAHGVAVLPIAVLGQTIELRAVAHRPSGRPGAGEIAVDEGTARMFAPWTTQGVRHPEPQDILVFRTRATEHPPASIVPEQRSIDGLEIVEEHRVERPIGREACGAIEPHLPALMRLRNHVMRAVVLEDERIGEMECLGQDDPLISPDQAVVADRQTDLPTARG